MTWGRALLTFSLVTGALLSVAVDLNESHPFNPDWPGHARFHDAAMLNLLVGVSALALWLLWRKSTEPAIGEKVAMLVPVIFWSAFFWVTWVVPGTDLAASEELHLHLGSIPVYPNVLVAAFFVTTSLVGYRLSRRAAAA